MKRKITDKLCEWKKQTKGRMPLLIYGARQVGKTFEMREFGAHYYKNTVYINFETDEKIGSYFETDIHADSVVVLLEKYYQVKIVPEETLIIFDEIQMCERALTSLKYFAEEAPEYHVMAAGSLLGVAVNREKYSFPVGKVQMLTMYPMDLEEVLWAKGKQILSDTIREHYNSNVPLEDALHEEAMQEFEHYCIIGGMPAAVKADIMRNSSIGQEEIRQMLLNSYIADMTKYADKGDTVRIFDNNRMCIVLGNFKKFIDELFKALCLIQRHFYILFLLLFRHVRGFMEQAQIADYCCERGAYIMCQIHNNFIFLFFCLLCSPFA